MERETGYYTLRTGFAHGTVRSVNPAIETLLQFMQDATSITPTLIIGGDTVGIADDLMSLSIGTVIAPHETDQVEFLARCQQRSDVNVRVNMDARVFTRNDWPAIETEWRRVASLAATGRRTSIGTGVLPYDASPSLLEKLLRETGICDNSTAGLPEISE